MSETDYFGTLWGMDGSDRTFTCLVLSSVFIFNIFAILIERNIIKILTIALILWRLGYSLRTSNTLSHVTRYLNYRISIHANLVNFVFVWRCLYPRIKWWRSGCSRTFNLCGTIQWITFIFNRTIAYIKSKFAFN